MNGIDINRGDYWARISPTRFGWYAMYGHGPGVYEGGTYAFGSHERITRKATRKLDRWVNRDERNAARIKAAK